MELLLYLNKMFLAYNKVSKRCGRNDNANSVDPDQTAPIEVVWSGSAPFAYAYVCQKLGFYGKLYLIKVQFSYVLQCQLIVFDIF